MKLVSVKRIQWNPVAVSITGSKCCDIVVISSVNNTILVTIGCEQSWVTPSYSVVLTALALGCINLQISVKSMEKFQM